MNIHVVSIVARWAWRGVALAALVLGLVLVPAAHADSGSSTLTVYAYGAPPGAFSSVQWRDRIGTWRDVDGWQSALEAAPDSSWSFKQWGVESRDYGRGPFRWLIYTAQGGSVWATSPEFYLPDGDGAGLAITLAPKAAPAPPDVAAAQAQAGFSYATIGVQAPGAPDGAWVGVQWRDRFGRWHAVEGWQGPMELLVDSGVAARQWAVYPKDYGRGPFRWVVYTAQGGRVWATSARFNLPDSSGSTLVIRLAPKVAVVPAEVITAEMPEKTLAAETSIASLDCGTQACAQSLITLLVSGAPPASWVGVQWLDTLGMWHDVRGWQGSLDTLGGGQPMLKQWTVTPDLYGRGPFRWIIYDETGDGVWGTSPSFTLPDQDGINFRLSLSGAS